MLQVAPWTQWLTWLLQVMPLFFIVGGYANAVSWQAAQRSGAGYGVWISGRLQRLVKPTVPLLIFWTALAIVGHRLGASDELIRVGSQFAMIPTWFLAVYVLVLVFAPATHTLLRRYGMSSFWGLVLGAVCVDAIGLGGAFPAIRWANYGLVWLAVHHLGYLWHDGRLAGPARALPWALAGFTVLIFLVTLACYPVSMISVPGEEESNSRPPTIALPALGALHGGLVLSLEERARRWLHGIRPWAATVLVNGSIMTLYLWHVSVLVLVVASPGGSAASAAAAANAAPVGRRGRSGSAALRDPAAAGGGARPLRAGRAHAWGASPPPGRACSAHRRAARA